MYSRLAEEDADHEGLLEEAALLPPRGTKAIQSEPNSDT